MTLRTILGKLRLKIFRLLLGRDLFMQATSGGKEIDLLRDKLDNLERHLSVLPASLSDLIQQRFDAVDQSISSLSHSSLGEFRAVVNQIHAAESIRETHSRVFPKYRNIYRGRDIVLFGTGPTLKYYQPKDNCIAIGCNAAVRYDKIKLDYLFVQDYFALKKHEKEILNYDCKKFFGRIGAPWGIPLFYENTHNTEIYYYHYINYINGIGTDCERDYVGHIIPFDLSVSPMSDFETVAHSAMQFALWTHPRRIYIAGCDCSHRADLAPLYFSEDVSEKNVEVFSVKQLVRGWKALKEFQQVYYPDVEIVSINPVFLKGVFKDEYTDSYLVDHPEIDK